MGLRSIGKGLAFATIGLLVGACAPQGSQSTFQVAGPVAQMQRDLFLIVFWVAVFIAAVVEGVLIFVIIRFRRRKGRQETPAQVHGNTRLEVAWTIAPALVLLIIAIPTVRTEFALSNPPREPDLNVTVVGHQWWWEFNYPDQGVKSVNELHIPVGKVIRLTVESADVMHSFWVPNLGGKMDAIPNQTNVMWLQSDEAREYGGLCAEFCGVAHAHMTFTVVAEPEEDFLAWLSAQEPLQPSSSAAPQSFMPAAAKVALTAEGVAHMGGFADSWHGEAHGYGN